MALGDHFGFGDSALDFEIYFDDLDDIGDPESPLYGATFPGGYLHREDYETALRSEAYSHTIDDFERSVIRHLWRIHRDLFMSSNENGLESFLNNLRELIKQNSPDDTSRVT